MTNAEKIKYILNKYPDTKFRRSEFFWRYIAEFIAEWKSENHEVELPYITKAQFEGFWKDFAGVERELREQLKGILPKEQDALRFNKASEFRKTYAKEKTH